MWHVFGVTKYFQSWKSKALVTTVTLATSVVAGHWKKLWGPSLEHSFKMIWRPCLFHNGVTFMKSMCVNQETNKCALIQYLLMMALFRFLLLYILLFRLSKKYIYMHLNLYPFISPLKLQINMKTPLNFCCVLKYCPLYKWAKWITT